jgi:hypothetical protein
MRRFQAQSRTIATVLLFLALITSTRLMPERHGRRLSYRMTYVTLRGPLPARRRARAGRPRATRARSTSSRCIDDAPRKPQIRACGSRRRQPGRAGPPPTRSTTIFAERLRRHVEDHLNLGAAFGMAISMLHTSAIRLEKRVKSVYKCSPGHIELAAARQPRRGGRNHEVASWKRGVEGCLCCPQNRKRRSRQSQNRPPWPALSLRGLECWPRLFSCG